jgi:hypothetical protein
LRISSTKPSPASAPTSPTRADNAQPSLCEPPPSEKIAERDLETAGHR